MELYFGFMNILLISKYNIFNFENILAQEGNPPAHTTNKSNKILMIFNIYLVCVCCNVLNYTVAMFVSSSLTYIVSLSVFVLYL